jgi:hypothetical protein
MKISITLPSLSPDLLNKTLDNIDAAASGEHVFQVLVCSPFEVDYRLANGVVIWIDDKACTGCVAAHWAAYEHATGDLITAFADDHTYVKGWDEEAVSNFLIREAASDGCYGSKLFSLGLRQVPYIGTVFGFYYPYFPLMRLADVKAIGGWYDSSKYIEGYSDPDLALRVWSAGGRCEWADMQTIVVGPYDHMRRKTSSPPEDEKTFLKTWAETYGKGWNLSHFRNWNIDKEIRKFPVEERTCFREFA